MASGEDDIGGRKMINSMIVRLILREAGMGERETIGDMIVWLVRREARAGRGANRGNSYIRWECD